MGAGLPGYDSFDLFSARFEGYFLYEVHLAGIFDIGDACFFERIFLLFPVFCRFAYQDQPGVFLQADLSWYGIEVAFNNGP